VLVVDEGVVVVFVGVVVFEELVEFGSAWTCDVPEVSFSPWETKTRAARATVAKNFI
jgi:hypothetical protein